MPDTIELDEVGSTNEWVRQNAGLLQDGQWVSARQQTGGRGRMGRPWLMPEGNLAASCLIRPRSGEGHAAELGFVAALALYDCCASHVDQARLQLKWPNDLLLDGKKISGILLEREQDVLVLGIGVNVAAAPLLPDRPTMSLREAGAAVDRRLFLDQLSTAFEARRQLWANYGFSAIRSDWLTRAHPAGTALRVVHTGSVLEGTFIDLAADGALRIRAGDDEEHLVHAGDVWVAGGVLTDGGKGDAAGN